MITKIASCYTYEGEIDPKSLFSYEIVATEQISHNMVILSLTSETLKPKYVVACFMRNGSGMIVIAYGYLDINADLKHYMFNGKGEYKAVPPNENIRKMLMDKLYKMHQMTNVEKEENKSDV